MTPAFAVGAFNSFFLSFLCFYRVLNSKMTVHKRLFSSPTGAEMLCNWSVAPLIPPCFCRTIKEVSDSSEHHQLAVGCREGISPLVSDGFSQLSHH